MGPETTFEAFAAWPVRYGQGWGQTAEQPYIVTACLERSDGTGDRRVFKEMFVSLEAAEVFIQTLDPRWRSKRIYKLSDQPIASTGR